jgi:hypothetical protein
MPDRIRETVLLVAWLAFLTVAAAFYAYQHLSR